MGGESVRTWLRELRLQKGLSEAAVAKRAGIAQPFYHNIEMGNKNPSVYTAKKLAVALELPWTRFYEDERKEGKGA